MTAKAVPTLQIDNARVRVTRWDFMPGAATGWHRHEMDYVIVPLTTGPLLIREPGGGERRVEMTAGGSYARPVGVEHNIVNPGPGEFVFVEVEVK